MNKVASSHAFEGLCQARCPRQFHHMEPLFSVSTQLISLFVSSLWLPYISHTWWIWRWAIRIKSPSLLWCGKSAMTWWTVVLLSIFVFCFYQLCILYLVMGISLTPLIDSVLWWNLVHPHVWCMNWSLHLDSNYDHELPECKKNMLQITIGLFKHVL